MSSNSKGVRHKYKRKNRLMAYLDGVPVSRHHHCAQARAVHLSFAAFQKRHQSTHQSLLPHRPTPGHKHAHAARASLRLLYITVPVCVVPCTICSAQESAHCCDLCRRTRVRFGTFTAASGRGSRFRTDQRLAKTNVLVRAFIVASQNGEKPRFDLKKSSTYTRSEASQAFRPLCRFWQQMSLAYTLKCWQGAKLSDYP